jgi:flagellar basal body-associated protein FliL
MKESDIYNSGYSFAKLANDRKRKILTILTIIFPIFILAALVVGFIGSLDSFSNKSERVARVYPNEATEEQRAEASRKIVNSYADAGIPYKDPQGRFEIRFISPFVSSEVVVVIRSEKDYDKLKAEADTIIGNAQSKVPITQVSYMKVVE